MGYFVTGATGFIGRHLVALLAERGEPVYVLLRHASRAKFERLRWSDSVQRGLIVPVEGDLDLPNLGVAVADCVRMRHEIRHYFHLGALYDLNAHSADLERTNVSGTRNALDFAHSIAAGCFHLISSIAVAGRYQGRFTEDMFAQATDLDHPYFRTKHESERLVRETCAVPWRIYRPGMVVGHSVTGVIDKVDGPYYLFGLIRKLRDLLPRWAPLPGFLGGHINLVPVDFVAAALNHLAHLPGMDGRCFHLTDPEDRHVGEALNLFAQAAHAPTMRMTMATGSKSLLGPMVAPLVSTLGQSTAPLRRIIEQLLVNDGIPASTLGLLHYPTSFDSAQAQSLLATAGIQVPRLEFYAWRLWDYWERQLDPTLHPVRTLGQVVADKTILVTGGSSGIGRAIALKLAEAGATVLIVARDAMRLAAVRDEILARHGRVSIFSCDIGDAAACDRFVAQLLAEHGHVNVLINNAGRSIRRAIDHSYDRLHDYERMMRINYHAAVRITLGLLPSMVERGAGHVVNISSISVLGNMPRFTAYNASKAALESFSRTAAAEYKHRGVHFTVINMPLVRTPMVAPTHMYDKLTLLDPERAADTVCDALVRQPERVTTQLGLFAQLMELAAPSLSRAVMSESFEMFPDSDAATGRTAGTPIPTSGSNLASVEMRAIVSLLHGIHW